MPKIVDSNTVTWSESSNELSATVGGDVVVDSVVIDDGGTIGSASDTDALTISSGGDVTLTQDLDVAGEISTVKPFDYNQIHLGGNRTDTARVARIMKNWDSPQDMRIRASSSTFDTPMFFETSSANIRMQIAANGDISFYEDTGSTQELFWDASAEALGVGTTTPGATAGSITPDGGVYLGGTAAANLLDDYEEGTWTPEYEADTGTFTTLSNSRQVGRYVKIGRVVHAFFRLRTLEVTVGTASGTLRVTGLPFTASTSGFQVEGEPFSQYGVTLSHGVLWGNTLNSTTVSGFINADSKLVFTTNNPFSNVATATSYLTVADMETGANARNYIGGTFSYLV